MPVAEERGDPPPDDEHMLTRTLAAGLVAAASIAQPVPAAASAVRECAGAVTRCDGTISVPLDWDDPASERISVAFAWIPAKERARGTVLANPGGPAPALSALPAVQQALGPVLDHHNLLVVEPRGLGESSPLLCPGLKLTDPASVAACADHLGPRALFFTAGQVVNDMDAVRRALGVPSVAFYGNSYGTLYAQAYAARHPGALDAVFLDSTVTVSPEGYARWPLRSAVHGLDLVCERSRACRTLPGSASGTWSRLVKKVRAHPDPEVSIARLVSLGSAYEPVIGREATAAATAYLRGDREPLRRLARRVPDTVGPPLEGPEWAGYLAHRCNDEAFVYDRDASPAERLEQLERHFREERPLAPYEPSDVGALTDLDFCLHWPVPAGAGAPVPPGLALPDVPVLAVGGDFDTMRPAEVAEALQAFPGATFLRVPFGGHSLAMGRGDMTECVRGVMRDFLTEGRVPGDLHAEDRDGPVTGGASCTAENYRAVGAFPRSPAQVAAVPAAGLDGRRRALLGGAFATVADAVARRNPATMLYAGATDEPGLRGGRVTFGDGSVGLDRVRYVPGVEVSGEIRLGADGTATAELRVSAGRRVHDVRMSWAAFTAEDRPAITGTFDGVRFSAPRQAGPTV